jgi:hypothetical protein
MNIWRNYSVLTLVVAIACAAAWLALPPKAVSSPVVEASAAPAPAPVPGMAEQFEREKRSAREEPLPAQF